MMDNIGLFSRKDEENKRAQINDLIQTLHSLYGMTKAISTRRLMFQQSARPEFLDDAVKSPSVATELRNIADEVFCSGKYDDALLAYTKCLAHAETDSELLGHAYANRSAASFKLGRYDQCVLDIDRALSSNYPEDKKQKLRERKDRCLSLMADTPEQQSRTNKSADQMMDEWRTVCDFKNPLLPNSSNKIKLECNKTWGRHMVATEDIEAGEILFSQEYFSLMIQRLGRWLNCSYCVAPCGVLIPCQTCGQAMFCSESCRTRAFDSYHRIECKILQSREIRDDMDKESWMALRMLMIGTEQGAGLSALMEKLTIWDIFAEKIDPTDKPLSVDYLSTLRLRRTFDRPLLNFTSNPVLIVKIIIALQDAGYFNNDPNRPNVVQEKQLSEMELFAALLLFNHMVSVWSSTSALGQFFDHAIGERYIGCGVNVLHNMINHSCDPNTESLLRGREMVVFAVRPISMGEQIFTVYTTETFMFWSLEQRTEYLSTKYTNSLSFTCQCAACSNNWPSHDVLRYELPKFLMAKKVRKQFLKRMLPVTTNRIHSYSDEEILQFISGLRKWFHMNVEHPSMVISHCELLLRLKMKFLYDSTMPLNTKDGDARMQVPQLLSDILLYFGVDSSEKTR